MGSFIAADVSNADRAVRAQKAVDAYMAETRLYEFRHASPQDKQGDIQDLIGDLLHLARRIHRAHPKDTIPPEVLSGQAFEMWTEEEADPD